MARKDNIMKTIINNSNVNPCTLTYAELKKLVPSTEGQKLPTAKRLKETGEILFSLQDGSMLITIYKNGFLAFTQPDETAKLRTTIFAVDRASQIVYKCACSKEEYEEGWEFGSCKVAYRMEKGGMVRFHIVPEEVFQDSHWSFPITHVCEERLLHNGDSREQSHIEFAMDDESWDEALVEPDFVETRMKEEEDEERRRWEHDMLEAAKATLTDVQRRTIDLYYGYGGMTEASVAELLGTSQQNVHKNLAAAIRKMKKFFEKTGC